MNAISERGGAPPVLCGKQAIDDASQTEQMVAALLGWARATFALRATRAGGAADGHA